MVFRHWNRATKKPRPTSPTSKVKNSLVESDALIKTMLNAVDAENSRATMETDRCVAEFEI